MRVKYSTMVRPGVAYYFLSHALLRLHPGETAFAKAIGNDLKGKISPALYLAAIPLAFVSPWLSIAVYIAVAVIWFMPDRRFERVLTER